MVNLARQKILTVLRTSTVRQSVITSTSIFLSSGLGAVYYLILARVLGPHDYGLFSLAIVALSIVISVADLGIAQGLVKFVGSNRENHHYFPYVKLAFQVKVMMGLVASLLFGIGSTIIAQTVFHQPELKAILPIVGLAVFFQLLFYLSTSIFQGLQKFLQWGSLQVGANIIRLILLLPLILFLKLNSFSAFLIFMLSYLIGFVSSLFWMDLGWLKSPISNEVKKEFWNFNRWTAIFVILASITARLDTVLTGRFLSLSEVGVYSLAVTMVSFLPQLASAVGAVTTAKFAAISDRAHEREYLRKSLFLVTTISIVISLLMIPTALAVVMVTGKAYQPAIFPFLILLLGNVIFMTTNPVRDSILYFHSRPKFFVFLSIMQATTIVISGLILIPHYGVSGAAISVGIGQFVSGVISVWFYLSIRT